MNMVATETPVNLVAIAHARAILRTVMGDLVDIDRPDDLRVFSRYCGGQVPSLRGLVSMLYREHQTANAVALSVLVAASRALVGRDITNAPICWPGMVNTAEQVVRDGLRRLRLMQAGYGATGMQYGEGGD